MTTSNTFSLTTTSTTSNTSNISPYQNVIYQGYGGGGVGGYTTTSYYTPSPWDNIPDPGLVFSEAIFREAETLYDLLCE